MNQVEFSCDDGSSSLTMQDRNPADASLPAKSFRLRVQCSDCVAGLTVDAESFAGLIRMLNDPPTLISCQTQWTSPAGEWRLGIQRTRTGYQFTSHLDSLLEIHRWKMEVCFDMSDTCAAAVAADIRNFIGTYE